MLSGTVPLTGVDARIRTGDDGDVLKAILLHRVCWVVVLFTPYTRNNARFRWPALVLLSRPVWTLSLRNQKFEFRKFCARGGDSSRPPAREGGGGGLGRWGRGGTASQDGAPPMLGDVPVLQAIGDARLFPVPVLQSAA